jgi:hypothetical protein
VQIPEGQLVKEYPAVENEIRFIADSPLFARIPRGIPIEWSPFDVSPLVLEKSKLRDHLEQSHQEAKDAISTYLLKGSNGFHLPVNLEGLIEQVVFNSGESLMMFLKSKKY